MEKTNSILTTALTVGLLALLIGVAVGYSLGINRVGVPGMGTHMMPNGATMRDGMMAGAADQHFIIQMIPHHEGAIEMAKVALERSKRPEILTLANAIIAAQQKEIDDMRSWHKAWYGGSPPEGGMGMHMGGMTGDTTALGKLSGDAFDREFMEQMIPHHEMAIMMAQMIRDSSRDEMRQLSENIITSQASEIEMMRGWLESWY
jgi:uncharacterized protein (DUF305 family)